MLPFMKLIPTSITTEPDFIQYPRTNSGFPTAAIIISADCIYENVLGRNNNNEESEKKTISFILKDLEYQQPNSTYFTFDI